ncbi:MAG TPA: MOSC domain-containing protein, partial [Afipia sp.]|nr:MOSC domain-containing protein [Afipia sp.]
QRFAPAIGAVYAELIAGGPIAAGDTITELSSTA